MNSVGSLKAFSFKIDMMIEVAFYLFSICFFLPADANQMFLKFGFFKRPPGYFNDVNLTVSHDQHGNIGISVYAADWLSERLNFTYEIVPMDGELGKSQFINGSGSWTGALGRLFKGDFDVLGPPILMSPARYRAFDYAGIADEENYSLLLPALTEKSPILSTLKPFTPLVWSVLLICLIFVAASLTTVSVLYSNQIEWGSLITFGDHIFNTVGILTNQGVVLHDLLNRYGLPFRLINAAWCLLAVVMINLYSSTLTSHMTARRMNTPVNSSFGVIEEGVLDYILVDDGFGREIILSATSGPLKEMGDAFRKKPENFVKNQEDCFYKVATGCCACDDFTSFFEFHAGKDFQKTGKCRVFIGEPRSGYSSVGLVLKKKSPYNRMINQAYFEIMQYGLKDHWRKKFVRPEASACQRSALRSNKLRPLNLRDLASAFFILGVGCTIALVVFLFEQIFDRTILKE